jgi:hypothetical protein
MKRRPNISGFEIIETTRTRDRTVDFLDGSWATFRTRPPGPGWTILADRDRATVWVRRKPVPVPWHRQRRGGRWLP